jgi:hypothetical protein
LFRVFDAMCVLEHRHLFRQKSGHRLLSLRVTIGPEWLHLHLCVAVLHDDILNSVWMF